MAIAVTHKIEGTGSGLTTTTASMAFANSTLYFCTVWIRTVAGNNAVSSITGGGLTWVLVKKGVPGGADNTSTQTEVWRGLVTSGAITGALTITLTASATRTHYSVDGLTGTEKTGTNGSGAIVQSAALIKSASTSNAVTLARFEDATSVAFGAFCHTAQESLTVDASPGGYVALTNFSAGPTNPFGTMVEWNTGEDTSVSASWAATVVSAGVAIEVRVPQPQTVTLGLIDQSPSLSAPAFSIAAPQTVTVPLIDQSAALFTPKMQKHVVVGLIDASPTLTAPLFSNAQSILAALIDQSPELFSPGLGFTVTTGLIDQSPVLFSPTFIPASRDAGGYIVSHTALRHGVLRGSPDLVRGPFRLRGRDGNSTLRGPNRLRGNAFAGKIPSQITLGLIDQSPTIFAPSVGRLTVTVPLINLPPSVFSPEARFKLTFPLLDATATVFNPTMSTVQSVEVGLIDASPTLTAPTFNPKEVDLPLLGIVPIVFMPSSFGPSVHLGLINQSPSLFGPYFNAVVTPLIDASPVVFQPDMAPVVLPLIDASPTIFTPDHFNIPTPQSVRFDDSPAFFLDQSPTIFAPLVELAPPRDVTVGLIDVSPEVFRPYVLQPTMTSITKRARYTPVITKRARWTPEIYKRARESKQR